jgi:hypothetical protein
MKSAIEFQPQTKFLRGESASGEAGAELIEHVRKEECQRLQ